MEKPAPATGGHVVLCGLNELGYRTLEELVHLGVDVVVVVRSEAEELAQGARELGATLVAGNYRDQAVLRAAGVPVASALVVTEDDDVGNLHAALAAQELNPSLRMRLRMFNRELGRRVEALFEDCQVFDSAALAVPALVSAALLQDWQQRVEVAGQTLVVRRAAATDPGVLLPLARVGLNGTAELFPEADEPVLCLVEAPPPARRVRHPERPPVEHRGRLAAAWMVLLGADIRLRVMTAIVLGLTVTGIAVFWWFSEQDLDLIDAIYFTVTIMTTTGFGDIHLRNAPPLLQLYGVALMLAGTAALAILFALITDALISARLARVLGANIPRGLHDHVIVCGLGNIGYRMVELLHELGVPLVAAELHESNRYLPAVRRLGVPVLVADIRLPETLQTPARRAGPLGGGGHLQRHRQPRDGPERAGPQPRGPGGAAAVRPRPGRPGRAGLRHPYLPQPLGPGRPRLRRRRGRRARPGHDRGRGRGPGRGPAAGRAGLPRRRPHRGRAGGGRRQPDPAPGRRPGAALAPRRRDPAGRRRRAGRGRGPRRAGPGPLLDRDRRPGQPPRPPLNREGNSAAHGATGRFGPR
jgi:voltage-gated potassium channel Kch